MPHLRQQSTGYLRGARPWQLSRPQGLMKYGTNHSLKPVGDPILPVFGEVLLVLSKCGCHNLSRELFLQPANALLFGGGLVEDAALDYRKEKSSNSVEIPEIRRAGIFQRVLPRDLVSGLPNSSSYICGKCPDSAMEWENSWARLPLMAERSTLK